MEDVESKAISSMENVEKSLLHISDVVEKMKASGHSLETVSERASDLEFAKLNVSLAFGIASLYYILNNVKGQPQIQKDNKKKMKTL